MKKSKTPIRFAIDTNVLGWLALVALKSKEKFQYYTNTTDSTYDDLIWLQNAVEAGKIELIVPFTVYHEILRTRQLTLAQQKNMTPDQIVSYNHNRNHRILSGQYLASCPKIKIAYINCGDTRLYREYTRVLANAYSQTPVSYDNTYAFAHRTKPFLLDHNNRTTNDALIMAEATLLGLDLISFDNHLVGNIPFDIPSKIQEINMDFCNSTVVPIRFKTLLSNIRRAGTDKPYFNKSYKHQEHEPIFHYVEFLTNAQYHQAVRKFLQTAQTQSAINNEITLTRTLFLKYLDQPLNIAQPSPHNPSNTCPSIKLPQTEQATQTSPTPVSAPAKQPEEPNKPTEIKETKQEKSKISTLKHLVAFAKSASQSKIKIDLTSPYAKHIIEGYLNKFNEK